MVYGKLNIILSQNPMVLRQTSRWGGKMTTRLSSLWEFITPRVFGPWRPTAPLGILLDEIRSFLRETMVRAKVGRAKMDLGARNFLEFLVVRSPGTKNSRSYELPKSGESRCKLNLILSQNPMVLRLTLRWGGKMTTRLS